MKPLGSNCLLNLRLKSQIPVLLSFLCYLPGVIVSCCALDASKTQTALISTMFGLFFEASWEQVSSKLAPSAGHALCLWSRPRSLVTPTFPGHARLRRPLSQITPTCRWSCHLSLVTPTVAGQTQKSLHPTRCVQFDVLCTSRAQRNAQSDKSARPKARQGVWNN